VVRAEVSGSPFQHWATVQLVTDFPATNELMTNRVQSRDFVKEFLAYIQVEKGLARHTLESYGRDLRRLEAWATSLGQTY